MEKFDNSISNEGDKRSNFRWLVVSLLFCIILINFVDRAAISFALEYLKSEFNLSDTQLGLILGSFGIGYIFTMFFGGVFADKYGAKKIFLIAMIFWGISMFSMSLSFGFMALFLSRLLLGLAEGPAYPCNFRVLADWIPINQRATAMCYVATAVVAAIAVGALLIPNLIHLFSWRWMFVILGILSLIWIPFWLYYFTDKPWDSKYVTQDELAIISNRKGNFLVRDGQENVPATMWRYLLVSPTYKTEEILAKDKRVPANHWKHLLTNKTLLTNYWGNFVGGCFFFFFLGWLPSYFMRSYHLNLRDDGLFTMLPWVLAVIFTLINARVTDYIMKKTGKLRFARSYPIIVGVFFATALVAPLGFINNPSLLLSVILISFAVGFSAGGSVNYYISSVDMAKRRAGTATAITGVTLGLAGFIAPSLTGYLIDITGNFKMGFLLLSGLGITSVIVVFLFHKPDELIKNLVNDENEELLDNPYYDYLQNIKQKNEKFNNKNDNKELMKKAQNLNLQVIDKSNK